MNGRELSKAFFAEKGLPALEAGHPEVLPHLAAGLVGEGSECFGMDDAQSRDHDWGAGFCIWLPADVYREHAAPLARTLRGLRPDPGVPSRFAYLASSNDGRVGVFSIEGFFQRFTGVCHPPCTLQEWWAVPDANLATAVNGTVFCDNLGRFSAWRDVLNAGYPRDVKLKKLAYCCYTALQAGQYNYPRMMRRGYRSAALLALTTFMTAALRMTYYLNDAYPPFYKWLHPLAAGLPVLGEASCQHADALSGPDSVDDARWPRSAVVINRWCAQLAEALCDCGLAPSRGDDLYAIAVEMHRGIEADWLRAIPLEAPC